MLACTQFEVGVCALSRVEGLRASQDLDYTIQAGWRNFLLFFSCSFFFIIIHLKSSPHPLQLFRKMLQVGGVGNDWIFILGERFFYTRYMLLRDLQGCWLKNVGLGTESGKQVTLTPLWNGLCFARLIVSGLHTDHRQECDDTVTSLLEKIRWNNQQHKLFSFSKIFQ